MALSLNGWTPLTVAIYWSITNYSERGSKEAATADTFRIIARDILSSPNFKADNIDVANDEEGTALYYATTYGMSELVPLLLKRGAKMDSQGGWICQFDLKSLETFLDDCISCDTQGKKVSEAVLQFDYTFFANSLDKEIAGDKIRSNNSFERGVNLICG